MNSTFLSFEKIQLNHINDEICQLTLHDPSNLNALDLQMRQELSQAMTYIAEADYKVLILAGNGRVFCAGGSIASMERSDQVMESAGRLDHLHDFIVKLRDWSGIVIASIHSHAAGAGVNLALHCDYIIAERTAKFTQSFSKIGLIPDCGGLWLLPRIIGPIKAKELMMCADTLTAQQYYDLHLINEVVEKEELEDRTMEIAKRFASGPMTSYALIKEMVNESFDQSLAQTLNKERLVQGICMSTDDFAEGILAFKEKRKANFK